MEVLRNLSPMLKLLQAMGVPQDDSIVTIVHRGQLRLLQLLPMLPKDKLMQLLSMAANMLHSKRLRELVIAMIEQADELPMELLTELAGTQRAVLNTFPTTAKRRVLSAAPALFLAETHQLIIDYTDSLPPPDVLGLRTTAPSARRSQSKPLQALVSLVAGQELYRNLVGLLHEIYAHTQQAGTAMLRCDLLMALHEQGDHTAVAEWDPSHRLICCIDTGLRQAALPTRLLREMLSQVAAAGMPLASNVASLVSAQSVGGGSAAVSGTGSGAGGGAALPATPRTAVAGTASGASAGAGAGAGAGSAAAAASTAPASCGDRSAVSSLVLTRSLQLADQALALRALPCQQLLARACLALLESAVDAFTLPKDEPQLCAVAQLLLLSSQAALLLKNPGVLPHQDRWDSMVGVLVHKQLPSFAALLVEDALGTARPPSASLVRMLEKQPVLLRVSLVYTLRRVADANETRVEQMLGAVVDIANAMEPQVDFIASLVKLLINRPKLLTHRIATAVVTRFLLPLARTLAAAHVRLLHLLDRGRSHLDAELLKAAAAEAWRNGVREDPAVERAYARLRANNPELSSALVSE